MLNGIDNLPIKDKLPTEPSENDLKKMAPISEIKTDTKPEPELNLTITDYINQAKKVFFEQFPELLKTAISGSWIRMILIGLTLLLALLFGLKII